jgi:gas vesicle protein
MRSRSGYGMSGSLIGLAVGLAAGVAAGLLTAPMRGSEMRASLRSRADGALGRGTRLLEEGRRAFNRKSTMLQSDVAETRPSSLTAPLGEIAQMHTGAEPLTTEGRS